MAASRRRVRPRFKRCQRFIQLFQMLFCVAREEKVRDEIHVHHAARRMESGDRGPLLIAVGAKRRCSEHQIDTNRPDELILRIMLVLRHKRDAIRIAGRAPKRLARMRPNVVDLVRPVPINLGRVTTQLFVV